MSILPIFSENIQLIEKLIHIWKISNNLIYIIHNICCKKQRRVLVYIFGDMSVQFIVVGHVPLHRHREGEKDKDADENIVLISQYSYSEKSVRCYPSTKFF